MSTTWTDDEAKVLLDELILLDSKPLRQPGDIDAQMYSDELGGLITKKAAEARLNKKVKEGLLYRTQVFDPVQHRVVNVWRKIT